MASIHPKYRPDIDGIRALAILLVVIFHAFPKIIPGGYIGVDIFFVISGFLISTIIYKSLDQGHFNFKDFYVRRIRRIFPALLIVLISVLCAGWYLLLPDEFVQLGKQVYKSGIFVLNFNLAHKGDYFDTSADLKPLLNLWSLCVEEQFYIVWPILIIVLHKYLPKRLLPAIIVMTIASFILNIVVAHIDPVKDFYLPFTRFWELSLGGILAWIALYKGGLAHLIFEKTKFKLSIIANALSFVGIFAIVLTSFSIDKYTIFPGWWALLPTFGTFFLIGAGSQTFINRHVLANRFSVFIGLISYPLYLWHWPLLSYLRISSVEAPPAKTVFLVILTAFVLAFLTYQFLEKKIRFSKRRYTTAALIVLMIAVIGVGFSSRWSAISPRIQNPETDKIFAAIGDWNYPGSFNFKKSSDFKFLEVKGNGKEAVLVIGDSHAEHFWPRLEKILAADSSKPDLVFATYGGCPPFPNINRVKPGYACDKFSKATYELALEKKFKTIVYISRWEGTFGLKRTLGMPTVGLYRIGDLKKQTLIVNTKGFDVVMDDFENNLKNLRQKNKKVIIVLSTPSSTLFDPKKMISRFTGKTTFQNLDRKDFESRIEPVISRLKKIAANVGAETIDPMEFMCEEKICRTATEDGKPIYKDADHIRAYYIREHGQFIDKVLD